MNAGMNAIPTSYHDQDDTPTNWVFSGRGEEAFQGLSPASSAWQADVDVWLCVRFPETEPNILSVL